MFPLLLTLAIVVVRLGQNLPAPGVDVAADDRTCVEGVGNGGQADFHGMAALLSGGALLKHSVFALGIMPHITANIILHLLTVVVPRLEALQNEGRAITACPSWKADLSSWSGRADS